jgi:hypothetical protein
MCALIFLLRFSRCHFYVIYKYIFEHDRIYGESHNNNYSTLKEAITSVIISCKGVGPKVYGILPFGRIEEYLEVRNIYSIKNLKKINENI